MGLFAVLAGGLSVLSLFREFSIEWLLLLYGAAFGAYVALVPTLRRGAMPLWVGLVAALALRAPWVAAPPLLSDDVWRYLHDGRAQLAGVNPYRFAPSAPEAQAYAGPEHKSINQPELPTIYPPAAQLAFRAAAALGGTLGRWKLLVLLFDLGIGIAVAALLRFRGRPPGAAAIYLLHPLPIIEFAGNAHVDALGILGLVAGLALLERRPVASGLAWACSVAAKYVSLPLIPVAARPLAGRRRLAFLGAALVALVLLYLPFLDHAPVGSLATFARSFEFNGSLYGLLRVAVPPMGARGIVAGLLLVLLAGLWIGRLQLETAALVWLAGLLLASPIVHPWYVIWLVPFLAWRREPWALAWSGTVLLSYAVLPGWLEDGVWQLPRWVPWVEYAPVWLLVAVRVVGWRRHAASPAAGDVPPRPGQGTDPSRTAPT